MSDIFPPSDFVLIEGSRVITDSRTVARAFKKAHRNVLRDIKNLLGVCPTGFAKSNFELCFENSELQNGKPLKFYTMTKDGFMLLAMGFTGEKAIEIKVSFISAFNKMRCALLAQASGLHQKIAMLETETTQEKQRASTSGRRLAEWRYKKPKLANQMQVLFIQSQMVLPLEGLQ